MTDFVRCNSPARRAVGWLMLLVGLVSVPSLGLDLLQRPHCVAHEAGAMAGSHMGRSDHAAPVGDPSGWSAPAHHDCSHCPTADCARAAPCGASTSTALSPLMLGVAGSLAVRVAIDLTWDQALSRASAPDTPPPQPIA